MGLAGEPRVAHGESCDSGLMQLDVGLLRAQLRGSKLLDALRIYRQGERYRCFQKTLEELAILTAPSAE